MSTVLLRNRHPAWMPITLPTYSNVIDDAVRNAGLSGDGAAVPGGVGVWGAATNLLLNGSAETDATNWDAWNAAAVSRITTDHAFGTACIKVVTPGSVLGEGTSANSAAGLALVAGTTLTGQVWVKGSGTVNVWTRVNNTDATVKDGAQTLVTLTNTWTRIVPASVSVDVGKTGDQVKVLVRTNTTQAVTYFCDGGQVETGSIATPFTSTSRAAARVQVPASVLSAQQGWVAMALRMGFAASQKASAGNVRAFEWSDGSSNNRLRLYSNTSNGFSVTRSGGGVTNGDFAAGTQPNWAISDVIIGVLPWWPTKIGVSINGVAYTIGGEPHIPTGLATTFDLGSAAGSGQIDSSLLWVMAGRTPPDNPAVLNAFGATPPGRNKIPARWKPTFYYNCVNNVAWQAAA